MAGLIEKSAILTSKLRGAEEKREEVIVVQTPDPMRTGRLEPVSRLEEAHDLDIP